MIQPTYTATKTWGRRWTDTQERNGAKRWNSLSPLLQSAALQNEDKQSIDGLLDQAFQADAGRRD